MPVQIGICDDCADDIGRLSEALYQYDDSFQVSRYTDGKYLLEDCSQHEIIFDIIFLDIYMPGLNGIEIAGKIRSVLKDVIIVFVSSSNEHYPEAYDVFAFNYIVKPLQQEKLNRVLDQALLTLSKEHGRQIQISYKGVNHRINCREILYLESRDKTIYFHLADRTTLQCYTKMDDILKQLPEESFIRCHQSFAVNIFHVGEMAEKHFRIKTTTISISKKYQKSSKDKYFNYLFTHMNK